MPLAVVFGAPMRAEEKENPTEFMDRVRAVIAGMLEQHSARILGTTAGHHSEGEAS
jgi:hypothetical protein